MTSMQFSKMKNDKLDGLINNFFWSENEGAKRRLHLLQSCILKLPKRLGGIGLRDIHMTNKAMLAKSCWRFITEPQSLASKWASHKYCRAYAD